MLIKCIFLFAIYFNVAFALNSSSNLVTINILGINDFHGQITKDWQVENRPVGGAAVLSSYLKDEISKQPNTLIAISGDTVGASPAASAFFGDEPTILFFNSFANPFCHTQSFALQESDRRCNIVNTIGNHEFDLGTKKMLDLIYFKRKAKYFTEHYPGAKYPYISANILDAKTKKLLFRPYLIKEIAGVRIGFIGAILEDTPSVVFSSNITGLQFTNEAQAINRFIPEMKKQGADIIVALIHQGGDQKKYFGITQPNAIDVTGSIVNIVKNLDDAVDVVLSAHTHKFTNAYLKNNHGKSILVTQAYSYSTAYAKVVLIFNRQTHRLVNKTAEIITTFADSGPGLHPSLAIQKRVDQLEQKIAPITQRYITTLKNDLLKTQTNAGESALGDLVADAIRAKMHADIAVLNPGSMRGNLYKGKVLWGNAFAVLPFSDNIVNVSLSGADIEKLLNEQWLNQPKFYSLQISGINYIWDPAKPVGDRIVSIMINKQPINKDHFYTVAVNLFLASGGNNFVLLRSAKRLNRGPTMLQAFIDYVKHLPDPLAYEVDNRIQVK